MPAAAVANLTPATGGISGNCAGASGEIDKARLSGLVLLLGRLVQAFDLCGLPKLRDELGLRLAREKSLNLALHLVEFRGLLGAPVLDLDDMPSELRFHRIGQLAGIHLERNLGELRHHLIFGEIAEVAALGGTWILRLFLCDRCEIAAGPDLSDDCLRFVLVIDQNMPGMNFFLAPRGL